MTQAWEVSWSCSGKPRGGAEAREQRGLCADQTYTGTLERLHCYRVDKGWAWARPLTRKQLSNPAVIWQRSDESLTLGQ